MKIPDIYHEIEWHDIPVDELRLKVETGEFEVIFSLFDDGKDKYQKYSLKFVNIDNISIKENLSFQELLSLTKYKHFEIFDYALEVESNVFVNRLCLLTGIANPSCSIDFVSEGVEIGAIPD